MDSAPQGEDWSLGEVLSAPRRLDAIWLVLPTAIAFFAFGLIPMRSWDYWWHITMGRLIDAYGAVPDANHFLYTMEPDAASYDQPWLAQLILYGGHWIGSVHLWLVVRNIVGAGIAATLSLVAMRRSRSVVLGSLTTLAALPFLLTYLEVRPHLLVAPIFVVLLLVGMAVRHRDWALPYVALFPAASAIWANLHGSFLVVALLAAGFAAATLADRWFDGRDFSPGRFGAWIGAAVASAIAALANPRGWEIYGYLYDVSTNPTIQQTISEWFPTTPGHPPILGYLFYAVVAAGIVTMAWCYHRLDPADFVLFVGFAILGALQNRSLVWFALVLPVTLAPYVGLLARPDSEHVRPKPAVHWIHTALLAVCFVAPILVQPTWQWRIDFTAGSSAFDVRKRQPMRGVVPDETPYEAVEVLDRYADPPRLFHDHRFAGFIMFHVTDADPRQLVFVDHRIELPPRRIWRRYEEVGREPGVWKGVFDRYDVGAALLAKERQRNLVGWLDDADTWERVVAAEKWVLFMPSDPSR